jgi:single-strand DNA-binding protein
MKTMNKVQLIGYLGKDPEFKEMQDGTLMARIRLATDYWVFPKKGEQKQYTDWHTVRIWGKEQVEKLRNYLIKGSHVLVEGRVIYRTYTDKQGQTRYVTEIRANYLVDLDR